MVDILKTDSKPVLIENTNLWRGAGHTLEINTSVAFYNGVFVNPDTVGTEHECQIIDANGALLMPGLVNAHTHLYSSLARGMPAPPKQPENFTEILENIWWSLDKKIDHETIYFSALVGGIDAVKQGVTSIFDHHASPNAIEGSLNLLADAMGKLGIRADLCYEVSDRDGTEKTERGISENIDFIKKTKEANSRFLSSHFGLHALFTLADKTLERINTLIEDVDVGFHIHFAEGPEDIALSESKYSMGVVERLKRFNLLKPGTILVHGVHLTSEDFRQLAATPVSLVHNPQSNLNNAVGYLDIVTADNAGLDLCLGTDGVTEGILSELRASVFAGHNFYGSPSKPGWDISFNMLFRNNYLLAEKAFGVKLGKIHPGYAADFILVDYDPPTPWNHNNAAGHFIFGMCDRFPVRDVFVGGKQILKDQKIIGFEEKEIYEQSRLAAEKLWKII